MSLSSTMQQVMRKQIEDIQERLHQFQVLPHRNVQKYVYDDVPNHIDILLFGPAGAGKTSLIKTFYRALHNCDVLPEQMDGLMTVKGKLQNEGTLKYTRVQVKPALEQDHNVNNSIQGDEAK